MDYCITTEDWFWTKELQKYYFMQATTRTIILPSTYLTEQPLTDDTIILTFCF
jgi:hypothetical protein